MTRKYRKLTVKASRVAKAIERGQAHFDDWQACVLEVLLIPSVYKRWKQANPRLPDMVLNRVAGKPDKGLLPEDNRAIGDRKGWAEFAGYTLWYYTDPQTGQGFGWNNVRDDYYSHSPGSTWNGVSRDTYHQFVYDLYAIVGMAMRGQDATRYAYESLERYGVVLVNDIASGTNG